MAFESNYERIQNKLYAELLAGPFYGVTTDTNTKLKTVDDSVAIVPASVITEETSTNFTEPSRNRRTPRLERRSWRWEVVCKFNQEIIAEAAQKRLIASHIFLARDPANDLEQVTLKLLDADTFHPPQQSPSSGTTATFTFEAELSPV